MENFDQAKFHKAVEQDIGQLKEEVEKTKKKEGGDLEKKEMVEKSLQSASSQTVTEKEVDYTQTEDQKSSQQKQKKSSGKVEVLPDYLEEDEVSDSKVKLAVEQLVDLVFHKGIFYALKKSKKYPPFIQDAFHDALVEKLTPILEEKDII